MLSGDGIIMVGMINIKRLKYCCVMALYSKVSGGQNEQDEIL
ncbi:hypothetical protein [Youngiibacter multivorans]|uniref:Uncharacterized protein n=1 Tax=Youngiibacter multivorans TaxID=937251 RepID=A0ABS4G6R7_9CLOT|nr:hypothetical protein [Youngiibacter multivorans]MBP1919970.1 hypothetical protein [Youngiibacter multivorans]